MSRTSYRLFVERSNALKELRKAYKCEKDARVRERILAVKLVAEDYQ